MMPLEGIRVVEFAGMGPAPFAAMVLHDFGAAILRIERPDFIAAESSVESALLRGRAWMPLDLKHDEGRRAALEAVSHSDVLIESNRPGVMERLGLGPQECLEVNPRLIYARMTGWGQEGPRAADPGHDINYIALTGILGAIGRADDAPAVPLNLVADYSSGFALVSGILAALVARIDTGVGRVLDVAMVDTANLLASTFHGMRHVEGWNGPRGTNLLDSGCPFYDVYSTADRRFLAVGAMEPKFFAALITLLGLDRARVPDQYDRGSWSGMRKLFAARFARRTLDEWVQHPLLADACVTPVLTFDEVADDPHIRERHGFDRQGLPAPAPRVHSGSDDTGATGNASVRYDPGEADWGFTTDRIAALVASGAAPRPPGSSRANQQEGSRRTR